MNSLAYSLRTPQQNFRIVYSIWSMNYTFKLYDGVATLLLFQVQADNSKSIRSSMMKKPFSDSFPIIYISQPVEWGRPSMIDAERRLLANALLDVSNERFVLLSETCIPIFNFTTVYNYLVNAKESFIGSYDDPRKVGRGRYNPKMLPAITISDWRKGSQWFEVHRKLAVEIISDTKYYRIFSEYCSPPCYMDEHYIPTLVNIRCPEQNSNRSITWVDWSKAGPHPGRFVKQDISDEFLDRIRFGENCTYNGNASSLCFLFARKFLPGTLQPFLHLAPTLLHWRLLYDYGIDENDFNLSFESFVK